MRILVTGGAGYIGSHTCLELLNAGYEVSVIDNHANSSRKSLERIAALVNKPLECHEADLGDASALHRIFESKPIHAVVHFAGLKAVGESVEFPLRYYANNVSATITLCRAMLDHDVRDLVFSSSCTVYGDPERVPVTEDCALAPVNPYGRSKRMIEQILEDLHQSDPDWNIAILRYFNPVGAHESGRIGEDPTGIPNNLFPYLAQVAIGRLPELRVFGNDYPTPDGTGIRDYIHVVDLAVAHIKALERIAKVPGIHIYNLGTGRGCSVLEALQAFERASGCKIPYRVVPRRSGDIAEAYADASRARVELGWTAQREIDQMCADMWRWQVQNPDGYR
jgi:UDP-glucose 4-epimerase